MKSSVQTSIKLKEPQRGPAVQNNFPAIITDARNRHAAARFQYDCTVGGTLVQEAVFLSFLKAEFILSVFHEYHACVSLLVLLGYKQ